MFAKLCFFSEWFIHQSKDQSSENKGYHMIILLMKAFDAWQYTHTHSHTFIHMNGCTVWTHTHTQTSLHTHMLHTQTALLLPSETNIIHKHNKRETPLPIHRRTFLINSIRMTGTKCPLEGQRSILMMSLHMAATVLPCEGNERHFCWSICPVVMTAPGLAWANTHRYRSSQS